MTERRDVHALADRLEPRLREPACERLTFVCESKAEAMNLTVELAKRGWKASMEVGINLGRGRAVHTVIVAGRR